MNINNNIPVKYIYLHNVDKLVLGRFSSKINLLCNINIIIYNKLTLIKIRKYLNKIINKYTGTSIKKIVFFIYYTKHINKYFYNTIYNMLSNKNICNIKYIIYNDNF